MEPTQSTEVPELGCSGGEVSKCDSSMYGARHFLRRGGREGSQPGCQIVSEWRSSSFCFGARQLRLFQALG